LISAAEADLAFYTWRANCGPCAIAAIMALTLDEVRPLMGDFEQKRYTSPTMMWEILDRIGRPWRRIGRQWPTFGLARIQWEGPWSEPVQNPRWGGYRETHWVASWISAERGHCIFDINATGNGTGWCRREDWERVIVPYLTAHVPRATGGWHVTHGVEIAPCAG
jgi:hypothetical protein